MYMKTKAIWLAIIVGLQLLWMAGVTISKETHLASGATALLETVPVDPRDLLRGDYLTLRYKVSDIPTNLFDSLPPGAVTNLPVLSGKPVYIVLEKRGEFHEAVAASFEPPPRADTRLVMTGTVESDRWRWRGNGIGVRYGIEQYFVREGTGNPGGKVTVRVAINKNGAPLIKEVYVNGKPYSAAKQNSGR